MIALNQFNQFLKDLITDVNSEINPDEWVWRDGMWIFSGETDATTPEEAKEEGRLIDHIIVSPTEGNLVKRIKDLSGIILAVKMPDADTQLQDIDNYSEMNHVLLFVIEKMNDGQTSDENEQFHYAKLQRITQLVKEYMLTRGMNSPTLDTQTDVTLAKPFRTEWEYGCFGSFNGLSTAFDLQDFRL